MVVEIMKINLTVIEIRPFFIYKVFIFIQSSAMHKTQINKINFCIICRILHMMSFVVNHTDSNVINVNDSIYKIYVKSSNPSETVRNQNEIVFNEKTKWYAGQENQFDI